MEKTVRIVFLSYGFTPFRKNPNLVRDRSQTPPGPPSREATLTINRPTAAMILRRGRDRLPTQPMPFGDT